MKICHRDSHLQKPPRGFGHQNRAPILGEQQYPVLKIPKNLGPNSFSAREKTSSTLRIRWPNRSI